MSVLRSLWTKVPQVVSRGSGYWKLNVSFLEDGEYISLISNFLVDWRRHQNRYSSLSKWWEACKGKIKGLSINYGVAKSRARSGQRDLLVRLAEHLKSKIDLGNSSCLGPYNSTLASLATLDVKEAQGAQVRSCVKWVEEGESSSAFFFRLEKKRGTDSLISASKDSDGHIVSDTSKLCDLVTAFYSSLFCSQPTEACSRDLLFGNVNSSLSAFDAEICEGPLTFEECHIALAGMAWRKNPWFGRSPHGVLSKVLGSPWRGFSLCA